MPLNHVRAGAGEPLVLIHPLGGDMVVWEPVFERLASERDVIALDMPGFGGSPALNHGAAPTPQALAAAVGEFLREQGIEHAHLAGNSLGGWVALELAKAGRALSVTTLSAAGFWARPLGPRETPIRRLGRALLPVLPLIARSPKGRRALLQGVMVRPERVSPRAARRLVRAYVTAPAFEAANAAMRSAVFEGIEEISAPVTLAWAEHDRLVARPKRRPAGARMVTLRGCGHVPTWDDPDQVARLLLAGAEPH
jgi:pimeloyl-ACP methyl ester carboxylesterase